MTVAAGAIDYAAVAAHYDQSRRAEPAITYALQSGLRRLAAWIVLEIGAGTANYSHELERAGFRTIALEPSAAMLEASCRKAVSHRIRGNGMALPLRSASVDAAIAVNVLHHLPKLEPALRELRRVVRKGVALQAVLRENLETLWYRYYFPEMDAVLLPLHPTLGFLITALLRAGFVRVESKPIHYGGSDDLTFEAARARPELLLDSEFRSATSGFRRLSSQAIQVGVEAVCRDLKSGKLSAVAEQYEHAHLISGDCFVIMAC